MPLDHYVSQVHLKNFYSPVLDGLMYGTRKSDLKCFRTKSQDVCRIEDGSTNAYLREDRAIYIPFTSERRVVAFGSAAARLMRTYATQVEVLRRLRNGGQQLSVSSTRLRVRLPS